MNRLRFPVILRRDKPVAGWVINERSFEDEIYWTLQLINSQVEVKKDCCVRFQDVDPLHEFDTVMPELRHEADEITDKYREYDEITKLRTNL